MGYWVVQRDGSPENMDNYGHYRKVIISNHCESWEKAFNIVKTLNESLAKESEARVSRNLGHPFHVAPGTTIISYDVVSDEGLLKYYEVGTRVVR